MNKLYSLMRFLWLPLALCAVMGLFFLTPTLIGIIMVVALLFVLSCSGNQIAKDVGWFVYYPKKRAPKDFITPTDFPGDAVRGVGIYKENTNEN